MVWKRRKRSGIDAPKENRIDALANQLQREGKIDRLESELLKFDPNQLEGAEKESWYHLYGIIPFQDGNRPLAFERFRDGLKQCPESGYLHFALGQEHEFRGESSLMFDCFEAAIFPRVPPQYAVVESRYAYLWDQPQKGRAYLEPLLPIYLDLRILDPTFLHIRGLPYFDVVWTHLAAFAWLLNDFERLDRQF